MSQVAIISNVARIYAEALFQLAMKNAQEKIFLKYLREIREIINSSDDLIGILCNPSVTAAQKKDILEKVLGLDIDKRVLSFIKILIDKNRISEIDAIYNAYMELLNVKLNKKCVEVISTFELDNDLKRNIQMSIEAKLNSNVDISWEIDKSLIAGLVFKFDDKIIDTSLKSKLQNLSRNL